MRRGGTRYAILVHDPDGDMGEGVFVGSFRTLDAALAKAAAIHKADSIYSDVECIVLPLEPGSTSARRILRELS